MNVYCSLAGLNSKQKWEKIISLSKVIAHANFLLFLTPFMRSHGPENQGCKNASSYSCYNSHYHQKRPLGPEWGFFPGAGDAVACEGFKSVDRIRY